MVKGVVKHEKGLGFKKGINYLELISPLYYILSEAKEQDIDLDEFLGTLRGRQHGPYNRAEIIRNLSSPTEQFKIRNLLKYTGKDYKPMLFLEERNYVTSERKGYSKICSLTDKGMKLNRIITKLYDGNFEQSTQYKLRQLLT